MKPTPTAPTDAAFAHSGFENENYRCDPQMGLSKREYFAAMALQAYCQRSVKEDTAAQWAVEAADALIKELNK